MNIDELTIGDLREIDRLRSSNFTGSFSSDSSDHPYRIGEAYLIRTVTHYTVGIVRRVGAHEIVMTNASWVANTGRFHDALRDGVFSEVEPYPPLEEVIVGRGAVVDATRWLHPLPQEQK